MHMVCQFKVAVVDGGNAVLLTPVQPVHGHSALKARESGLPLIAVRSLAMQASITDVA
jgi:hypothetical protein